MREWEKRGKERRKKEREGKRGAGERKEREGRRRERERLGVVSWTSEISQAVMIDALCHMKGSEV